jgi:phosphoribosyl 1,2-cyclic phosphodiesterase
LRVTALASGSSGNAFLVQTDGAAILVDAGLAISALAGSLASLGTSIADLDCLLLTHEHSDHLASAGVLSRRHKLPIVGTEGTLGHLVGATGERVAVPAGARLSIGDLAITPFAVPHDGDEPVGYLLEHGGVRVCLATDLGHVPGELIGVLRDCALVILEANHDVERLWRGPYPRFLKRRVSSAVGHLSNEQAAECLALCASGRPQRVWLAHLSQINNSPRCALNEVTAGLNRRGIDTMRVEVALRDRPSLSWGPGDDCVQPRLL